MSWKKWLYGLGAAVIGGSATAIGGAVGASFAGQDVMTLAFWKIVAGCAVFGGLTNAVAYLKQSPLPSGNLTPAEVEAALKRIEQK
jgi:zinc transporter ZupT